MRKKDIERMKIEEAMIPDYAFDDTTILESGGDYKEVAKIMKKDGAPTPWFLHSNVTISHPLGAAQFKLQFQSDRDVHVLRAAVSNPDPQADVDVRILKRWCMDHGWRSLQPAQHPLREMPEFWRYLWKTYIVDCEALDKRYGKRKPMKYEPDPEEEENG